jgi:phospholipid/cholesterol/gamma-HCH transport system permease protein
VITLLTQSLQAVDEKARDIVEYVQGVAQLAWSSFTGLFRRPFYLREYVDQIVDMGVSSLPIVVVTGLVTGMVLALQTNISLDKFGATSMLGNAIVATLVRELGPIMGALILAGRVGAGVTSQIGAMKVTSQIDALVALGSDPVKKLVLPRVLVFTLLMPLLITILSFCGVVGGWLLAKYSLNFPTPFYWFSIVETLRFIDIASGLTKAAAFGFVISLVASYEGLTTQGGTYGVGQSTTRAVVVSALGILVCNFFITRFFYSFLLSV